MEKSTVLISGMIIAIAIITGIIMTTDTDDEELSNGKDSQTEKVTEITPNEFQQQKEEHPGVVIDVRTQEEYDEGHLADVDHHFNLLSGYFETQLDSLDKDQTYYLYCRTGNRSGKAAALMVENGYQHVYNIGGFQDLVDAGVGSK